MATRETGSSIFDRYKPYGQFPVTEFYLVFNQVLIGRCMHIMTNHTTSRLFPVHMNKMKITVTIPEFGSGIGFSQFQQIAVVTFPTQTKRVSYSRSVVAFWE
jgi:hypothetical protein